MPVLVFFNLYKNFLLLAEKVKRKAEFDSTLKKTKKKKEFNFQNGFLIRLLKRSQIDLKNFFPLNWLDYGISELVLWQRGTYQLCLIWKQISFRQRTDPPPCLSYSFRTRGEIEKIYSDCSDHPMKFLIPISSTSFHV